MKTLFLIRHAKSSWDHPALRDFQRPLNERGLADAPRMARLLAEEGGAPQAIVSSPARRALTTAQFFAAQFGIGDQDIIQDDRIYQATPLELVRVIGEIPDKFDSVCIFGHNPTFTDVANLFADDYIDNVPTCGIVRIESSAASWRELYVENSKITACFFPKEVL